MVARVENWRLALAEAVHAYRRRPFEMGVADCCLSTADLARAICGEDLAAPLRGYSTDQGAMKRLRRAGFESVRDYLDARLPRVSRPREGDVAVIAGDPLDTLMMVAGRGMAWTQVAHGLELQRIPDDALFWGLG